MYVFLCLKKYLLIYSAASDLSCSLWDLWCSLQHARSSLWHVGSDSLTRDWTRAPCIECGVWASGPPGRSLYVLLVSALCPLPLSLSRLHLHLCSPDFHQQSYRLAQVCRWVGPTDSVDTSVQTRLEMACWVQGWSRKSTPIGKRVLNYLRSLWINQKELSSVMGESVQALEPGCLGSNSVPPTYYLWDLG